MSDTPPIVITGATGFLGRRLVQHFLQENHAVTALVRPHSANADAIPGDVELVPLTSSVFDQSHFWPSGAVLVHLATHVAGADTSAEIEREIDANLVLPIRLFEAARAAGVRRIVNVGSFWEYDENGKTAARRSYAAMKSATRLYLDYLAARYSIAAATLTLSETYAPHDDRRKLIPLLLTAVRSGIPLDMTAGHQETSFCHVEDIARAFSKTIMALDDAALCGHHVVYHVNGGESLSIRALVDVVREVVSPRKVPVNWNAIPTPPGPPATAWLGDAVPPGWRPEISLPDGLRQVWNALPPLK